MDVFLQLASQSRQFKEEQEKDVQNMLSMGSTITSLEEAVRAKDNQLTAFSGKVHELEVALIEREGDMSALTEALDARTQQLKEIKEQVRKTWILVEMNLVCWLFARWTDNSKNMLIK